MHARAHTHTHTYIYIYIYIFPKFEYFMYFLVDWFCGPVVFPVLVQFRFLGLTGFVVQLFSRFWSGSGFWG
jgi:hypothetical protein